MFKLILIFIILIINITPKEYIMKKNNDNNNEFSPYIFEFNFKEKNYSFIFDTSSYIIWVGNQTINKNNTVNISTIHGKKMLVNEICRDDKLCYFITDKEMNKGYSGSIGLSNKHRNIFDDDNKGNNKENNNSDKIYQYINYSINKDNINEEKYINFIQKNKDEASMIFGHKDNIFKDSSPKCQCKVNESDTINITDNNIYWCCEISTIKLGENKIYLNYQNNRFGIFSISEEYIIAPLSGFYILTYFEKYIKDNYGVNCKKIYSTLTELKCDYFNYKEMPDLTFMMKGNLGILALSRDLFKKIDNDLELKIKINWKIDNNYWYLGEPIVKNYNFLFNYTNLKDVNLIIVPWNQNGFVLIIIAIIIGFIILISFIIIIIHIIKKSKNKNENNTFFSSGIDNQKKENTFFSFGKNSISKNNYTDSIEKIEEEEDEETELNKNKITNINNINNIENNSLNNINNINNMENNSFNNNIINNSFNNNNITNKNNNIIKNNNLETPISVEFSLNDIGDEFDDNDDLFIKQLKK